MKFSKSSRISERFLHHTNKPNTSVTLFEVPQNCVRLSGQLSGDKYRKGSHREAQFPCRLQQASNFLEPVRLALFMDTSKAITKATEAAIYLDRTRWQPHKSHDVFIPAGARGLIQIGDISSPTLSISNSSREPSTPTRYQSPCIMAFFAYCRSVATCWIGCIVYVIIERKRLLMACWFLQLFIFSSLIHSCNLRFCAQIHKTPFAADGFKLRDEKATHQVISTIFYIYNISVIFHHLQLV